ncbi:hypothetical protein P8A21_16795 [Streptomyces poriferorum]|uniref:hypothetical protein n=1 Tax=Streptomyces poriferorum TaxID=2798799 RepID=UPI00273D15E5|nr:hypothetical protein [Streptomyces sp. Alt1]WLQ49051.1 hypothetical protein P8A21_16795 [Streptomyces sp. Alt1]
MSHHSYASVRRAAYTALLLALTVLLSLVLPTGSARAYSVGAASPPAAEDCAELPLSRFGEAASAAGTLTIPGNSTACLTFTAKSAGLHRLLLADGTETYPTVYDGETALDCYDPEWGAGWCSLARAGIHTITLLNAGVDVRRPTVSVVPLETLDGCEPEISTAWDAALVTGSAAGPTAVQCRPFTGRAGERITNEIATTVYGDSMSWITDETGARICPHFNEDGSTGCVLPGDGPYRVLSQVSRAERGFPAEYTLKVRRLSDPEGCAHVELSAYNSAPTAAEPATGCKTFTAPAAGRYDAYEVGSGARTVLGVYDRAGRTVCTTWSGCSLPAPGDYTVLTDDATLIFDRTATAGCVPVELGRYTSTFAVAGEIDCLGLPLPAGARLAILKPLSTDGPRTDVIVIDADGAQVCDRSTLSAGTCALTGEAPFRALVSTSSEDPATGAYALALYRTDAAAACPAVPAGDFTAAGPAARISTGDGVFAQCLTIPADDHSAWENLQLKADPGTTSTAGFTVLDPSGAEVCSVYSSLSTWTTCALAPGAAHTVLFTGRDTAGSYTLTRRDVTASAKGCTANPATGPGGASTGGALGAPGTLQCRQVTTPDARDTVHVNVRDAVGTARIVVYGASGEAVCNSGGACAVTGSTHYQVLVTVGSASRTAPSYRFDAVRVATAAGPAPECTKVPNISYGYGPFTGVLDEQHATVCAVLPTADRDRFSMNIGDTAGATDTAVPALYNTSLNNGCILSVPSGYECAVARTGATGLSPSTLVLSLPETAARTDFTAELVCESAPCGPDAVTIGSLAPATGASGTKATVKLSGTALHQGDKVRISLAGKSIEGTTTAVSADRRTLTAVLDLTGAAVGTWSVSVITHQPIEYLHGSFTVTPAPLVSGTAPVISGTPRVGARLTVSTGTWSGAPTSYTHQWYADGKAVTGATASTYTPTASLLGKKLGVKVTARKAGTPDVVRDSATVTVAVGVAPKATTAPRITGTVRVGTKLTAAHGTWSPAPTSYAYQWKVDGKAVKGATASTYTPTASLLGRKLSVTVTARRTGHTSGAATPTAVKVAVGSAPKATRAPTLSGTAKVGRTLKAARGTWSPAPTSYTYQWYANGKAIKGATKSSLLLKTAVRGKKITVKVTARRTGHTSAAAISKATKAVAR